MNMKKALLYGFFLLGTLLMHFTSKAQSNQLDTLRVEAFITPEGDTIPQSWLPTVEAVSYTHLTLPTKRIV